MSETEHKLGDPAVSIVRLPDGRWAARNERDISDITAEDLVAMLEAFKMWWSLTWERHGE